MLRKTTDLSQKVPSDSREGVALVLAARLQRSLGQIVSERRKDGVSYRFFRYLELVAVSEFELFGCFGASCRFH